MKLSIEHISKKYGGKEVLRDIDFEVNGGECVGILGGNGSGKSTLFGILSGVLCPTSGRALLEGVNVLEKPKVRRANIGYLPQETPLITELSARDNLLLAYGRGELGKSIADGTLEKLGVTDFLSVPVSKMSGGMKKRLSIALLAAGKPKIMLLDEPSAALDLSAKRFVAEYISDFVSKGGAVLLATHDVSEIAACDRCFIIKDGVLLPYEWDGDADRLAHLMEEARAKE